MDHESQHEPQQKGFLSKTSPKNGFFMGLMVGITAVSLIGFLSLLGVVVGEDGKTDTGIVKGAEKAVAGDTAEPTDPTVPTAPVPEAPAADVVITADDHSIGPDNATVTLVEYSDFECPFCARHYETMKNIRDKYSDSVRIIFRHFPLSMHENARPAALASECAAEQGKFWEMHDIIFENNESLSDEALAGFANEIGLDNGKFKDCYESEKYDQVVTDDMASGIQSGVQGTPATFVITDSDQTMISGAVPQAQVEAAIDQALGK